MEIIITLTISRLFLGIVQSLAATYIH